MKAAFMRLNGKRYLVPYWVEVDESVTFENVEDYIPEQVSKRPSIMRHRVPNKPYEIVIVEGNFSSPTCTCPGYTFRKKCKHVDSFLKGEF